MVAEGTKRGGEVVCVRVCVRVCARVCVRVCVPHAWRDVEKFLDGFGNVDDNLSVRRGKASRVERGGGRGVGWGVGSDCTLVTFSGWCV